MADKLKELALKQNDDWVRRTGEEFEDQGGNDGAILLKERGRNPLVDVANEVFREMRKKKAN